MSPKVSVIIPTYNFAKYLPEAIESVLKQTFKDWELFIVDDGSSDGTAEVVRTYLSDSRIKYVYQDNRGLPAARNTGLRASTGEYSQFLDADDLIHAEKLESQSRFLDNNPGVDVVFSDHVFFRGGASDTFIEPHHRRLSGDIKKDLLAGDFIIVSSALTRRKVIDAVGGYDETLTSTEDWDLWLRLILSGAVFVNTHGRMVFVRLHQSRMSTDLFNLYSGRYAVIKKALMSMPVGSVYWRTAKKCYVMSKLAMARESLYQGRFDEAVSILKSKPRHISFFGAVNFVVETAGSIKNIMQRVIIKKILERFSGRGGK